MPCSSVPKLYQQKSQKYHACHPPSWGLGKDLPFRGQGEFRWGGWTGGTPLHHPGWGTISCEWIWSAIYFCWAAQVVELFIFLLIHFGTHSHSCVFELFNIRNFGSHCFDIPLIIPALSLKMVFHRTCCPKWITTSNSQIPSDVYGFSNEQCNYTGHRILLDASCSGLHSIIGLQYWHRHRS